MSSSRTARCRSRRQLRLVAAGAAARDGRFDAGDDHDADSPARRSALHSNPYTRRRRHRVVRGGNGARRRGSTSAATAAARATTTRTSARRPAPTAATAAASSSTRSSGSAATSTRRRSSTSRRPTACRSHSTRAADGDRRDRHHRTPPVGARRGRRQPGGARRRPGRHGRLATRDDGARSDRRPTTRSRSRSSRTASLAGADLQGLDLRVHIHGPDARQRLRRACPASRGSTCRRFAASVNQVGRTSRSTTRRSRTPVPARLDAAARPGASRSRRPAVGKHTIYARSTQGFDDVGAGVHDLHGEEVTTMKKRSCSRRSRPRSLPVACLAAARRAATRSDPSAASTCRTRSNVGNPGAAAAARSAARRPDRPSRASPAPVNMAYFGGHVQVTPKIYLVFWGWGQAGRVRPHDARRARRTTRTARPRA